MVRKLVMYFHTRKILSNPDFFRLSYQISGNNVTNVHPIQFAQTILKVRMVKTPKAVVESDFDYLVENLINKKYVKKTEKTNDNI